MRKQQEMEYVLMQTCNERDNQAKIIEELSNKYILLENDKNELEHLVCFNFFKSYCKLFINYFSLSQINKIYQHETEIYNLRQINKNMLIKLEQYEYPITGNKFCDKRRSMSVLENNTIKKNSSSKDLASHLSKHQHNQTVDAAPTSDTEFEQKMITNSTNNSSSNLNESGEDLKNTSSDMPTTTPSPVPVEASSDSCSSNSNNIFNFMSAHNSNFPASNCYKNHSFSGSNLDEDDEDNDYDVEDNNYLEFVKVSVNYLIFVLFTAADNRLYLIKAEQRDRG